MATLNQHRKRPTLAPLDLRDVPVKEVVANYQPCQQHLVKLDGSLNTYPESDAIEFYLKNAAMAQVAQLVDPNAPLGKYEPLIESYQATVRTKSLRMFYYLLLICTRESRHVHHNAAFFDSLTQKYGKCMSFTKGIKGSSSDGAVNQLLVAPPDATMGAYTEHLLEIFDRGATLHLFSGGYGGKAWASIAKVLRNFVHGVTSAELMLDTGFTLAHNNGPIFNKQVLFHHYDQHELLRILDVQRAGMIPQYVHTVAAPRITQQARQFRQDAEALLGEFGGVVDWDKVEALGAVQTYSTEKAQAKKALGATHFDVPGVVMKKVKRAA